ncbi:glycine cleavage T C-terminal barrel domain-containing protein [Streptomyces sp. NPDC050560]|uniref:glycine cleavage T C-terminal barrel domain-containing protein n=1 Tax=Streptomyces sp. NPDC050560 TaxID=3365630 RepID=UPI0037B13C0F
MSIADRQRRAYEALAASGADAPFLTERPALFSPAAAAQDALNTRGAYGRFAQILLPLEYTGWVEEATAHVRSCYIGDWTSLHKVRVRGPQALPFLDRLGMRGLSRFGIGHVRHHVQLDDDGYVASEGVLIRGGEREFVYTAGSCDWLLWRFSLGDWDAEVTDISPERFLFGVQGPASLPTLEKATGGSLRDLGFGRGRRADLGGVPVDVLRTGISGELGYEVHGGADDAGAVWSAVLAAGEEFGIRQLGFRSQPVQHIEAGIATNGLDYLPSALLTPGAPRQFRRGTPGGSFVPAGGVADYFRTPGELGWGFRGGVPEREFTGRDALAAQYARGGPSRVLVGLVWNAGDVAEILTSLTGAGDIPDQMEVPRAPGPHFDQVTAAGEPVGIATGRTLSPTLRATVSLCVIAREHAAPGTPVDVTWGRRGTPQRTVRATVAALPFKPDRRRTDVGGL